jgi:hypothetical protein
MILLVSSIHLTPSADSMSRHLLPIDRYGRSRMLNELVVQARSTRRCRMRQRFSQPADIAATPDHSRRRRAALLVERTLRLRSSGMVDCAQFFTRLVTQLQMASAVICTMMSSVADAKMGAARARILATIITELVYFLEEAVPAGASVRMCMAIALDDDRLVVGLGAEGGVNPVSSASAFVAMLRARDIVSLMDGDFQRGVDGGRQVFGLTFDADIAETAGW